MFRTGPRVLSLPPSVPAPPDGKLVLTASQAIGMTEFAKPMVLSVERTLDETSGVPRFMVLASEKPEKLVSLEDP